MLRHELAVEEVIKLHINHSTVDTLDGGRVANGTLDSITGASSVATMNTPKSYLPHTDRMLSTRRRGLHVLNRGLEDFDILCKQRKWMMSKVVSAADCGEKIPFLTSRTIHNVSLNEIRSSGTARRSVLLVLLSGDGIGIMPDIGI